MIFEYLPKEPTWQLIWQKSGREGENRPDRPMIKLWIPPDNHDDSNGSHLVLDPDRFLGWYPREKAKVEAAVAEFIKVPRTKPKPNTTPSWVDFVFKGMKL